jgi:hypothetical protein
MERQPTSVSPKQPLPPTKQEWEQVCGRYFESLRGMGRAGLKSRALLTARVLEGGTASEQIDRILDEELDRRFEVFDRLSKEQLAAYIHFARLIQRIRDPDLRRVAGPALQQTQQQQQQAGADFGGCTPTQVTEMTLYNWQILEYPNLQILNPPTPSNLQVAPNNPYAQYSAAPSAVTPFRFHVSGGPDGSVTSSLAWGFAVAGVGCGFELYCRTRATGLVNILPADYIVPHVDVDLQITVRQYRDPGVDFSQIPYWGGFFGASPPNRHALWRAYPLADFDVGSPSISTNVETGVHPIHEHSAEVWLRLVDVQDGDFFLITYHSGVLASEAYVDLSWNNMGTLIVDAPFAVQYQP